MKRILPLAALLIFTGSFAAFAEEDSVIAEAMKFAHKAPKGEKKLNEKIADGTASDADIKKALDLYKKMADAKPPKGDQAAFKIKVAKLVEATQEIVDKKQEGVAHYKEAVNCKACHSEFKADH
jgi:hypothetical protein